PGGYDEPEILPPQNPPVCLTGPDGEHVDEKSVDAWQVQLSVEEMQTITDLIGVELMIQLGYEAELRHAQQAGVVDKGREVTELYRQIFRMWWDLRLSKERAWSSISANPLAFGGQSRTHAPHQMRPQGTMRSIYPEPTSTKIRS
ncbi:hypothetical protein QJT82_43410, partial [Bradyrhizobium sp. Mp19]|nr:hypothetical protein [Bradyrhizobium sp. Mp19]